MILITGQATPDREAVIPIEVRGVEERQEDFTAVLDTGFTEYLTLSSEIIARLGLKQVHTAQVVLGDGSEVQIPVYRAKVGMSLLYGSVLRIRVIDGGEVTIKPLG